LTLYGSSLLYKGIEDTGCDPSGGVKDNETCESSGPDVFGAMLGVAFAAQGISQVGSFLETFSNARTAAHTALQAINRKPGAPAETIYYTAEEIEDLSKTSRSSVKGDLDTPEGRVKAILPQYKIDSSSEAGQKPEDVGGRLTFEKVCFSYPTRPGIPILKDFSIDVAAGKTVAFVGPR
jgi:ATP-binding cassette, subfamily B (MDR/TAP), member 1